MSKIRPLPQRPYAFPRAGTYSVVSGARHVTTLGAALLCLSGCAVGPDFVEPAPSLPVAWTQSGGTSEPVDEWWTLLGDPLLVSLIDRSHAANLDLKQAVTRIEQSRARSQRAFGALLPALSATGDGRRSGRGSGGLSIVNGSTVSTSPQQTGPTNLFRDGFDAAWELDLFGGIRRGIEAAEASVEQARHNYRAVLVSLNGEVATRYATLRGLQEQLRVTEENIALQRSTLSIVDRRQKGGFASALESSNAKADLANTEATLPPIRSALSQEIYALSYLLAEEPQALLSELAKVAPLPTGPLEPVLALPATMIRQRPDIAAAEQALHAATAEVGVAIADLYPKVSLSALTRVQGETLGSLDNWSDRLWSLVAALNQPIFAGGRLTATVREKQALREEAALEYQKKVLQALREVESALANVTAERTRADALARSVTERREALRNVQELYRSGLVEFLQVLDVQRTLFTTESNLAISRRDGLVNLVGLYKALGGGARLQPLSKTAGDPSQKSSPPS